jgi:hypothetical protein
MDLPRPDGFRLTDATSKDGKVACASSVTEDNRDTDKEDRNAAHVWPSFRERDDLSGHDRKYPPLRVGAQCRAHHD